MICGSENLVVTEKEGYAPDTGKGDKRKDYSADNASLSAEEPAYDVELEETDAAPVNRSNNYEKQSKFIKH